MIAITTTLNRTMPDVRAAVAAGDLPTLLLVLAHLTGEDRWLHERYGTSSQRALGDRALRAALGQTIVNEVIDAAAALAALAVDGRLGQPPPLSPYRLTTMLGDAIANRVPPEAAAMLEEELGLRARRVEVDTIPGAKQPRVLVIGCGISGVAMAIQLRHAGLPFTILERNDGIGGVWHENRYPGCGVDTPSHIYTFTFDQPANWPMWFSKAADIKDYLERLVDKHGLRPHIRLRREVTAATWNDTDALWHVETGHADGQTESFEAEVVVWAVGLFNEPAYPDVPGLADFAGPLCHTARWDDDLPIRGKRIGVLGTGASAMQLVPSIADRAGAVTVFQRTPHWVHPNPLSGKEVAPAHQRLMMILPYYLQWYRLQQFWNFTDRSHPALHIDSGWPDHSRAINRVSERYRQVMTAYIEHELGDRADLLAKCLPKYPVFGKRPLLDCGWLRTMKRDDVQLVSGDVAEIQADRIVMADGRQYPIEVLILATGFRAREYLGRATVVGRSGHTLRETWGPDDARAYLGMTIPDFPNMFMLYGPNTNAGGGGHHVLIAELQVRYTTQLLRALLERDARSIEVRRDVHDAYNLALDEALANTVWSHRGASSYFQNDDGRIVVNMPWTNTEYWQMTRHVNLNDYHIDTR